MIVVYLCEQRSMANSTTTTVAAAAIGRSTRYMDSLTLTQYTDKTHRVQSIAQPAHCK